ncbi:MAG: SNF2 family DNA or RNA helicase [Psychromonas sp.]|jgi:SNF2 family DNA or RNA helicase
MTDWAITTTPLTHQDTAFMKMMKLRVGGLFMDMGTGKSLVVIMLAFLRRQKISKVVWCCPVSLKLNTHDQIMQHTSCIPGDVNVFNNKTASHNLPNKFWHIVGLESLGSSDRVVMAMDRLIDDKTMLVVDESSFIKGHRSNRSQRLILLGGRARYRLVLNGTPISQGIEDLYTQITFLSTKILGYTSWYAFRRKHLEYSEHFKGMIKERYHTDWLGAKIAPYVYQVTKEECLTLPTKTTNYALVEMTGEQQAYYQDAKKAFEEEAQDLDFDDMGGAIFRLFSALQSVVNGVIPANNPGAGEAIDTLKNRELIRHLGQLQGKHVVVWVKYRRSVASVQSCLEKELPDINISKYYGDMNEAQRADSLARWRRLGGVFVATASCGGYGLTLVESHHALFYTNTFKYSERIQAEDRLHRIGQTLPVSYFDIWVNCGIEDRIRSAIGMKADALGVFRSEIDAVKDMGKGQLKNLIGSL